MGTGTRLRWEKSEIQGGRDFSAIAVTGTRARDEGQGGGGEGQVGKIKLWGK